MIKISIHAPRTGSDILAEMEKAKEDISIHAPRTGSDTMCAGRQSSLCISIHAPRTGSDVPRSYSLFFSFRFQSTLPARGATSYSDVFGEEKHISIHAPRTGSDAATRKS